MYKIIAIAVMLLLLLGCDSQTGSLGEKMLSDSASRNGAQVCKSPKHQMLSNMAQIHAESMAKRQKTDHQDFNHRAGHIYRSLNLMASEICAQTTVAPTGLNNTVGDEVWQAWRQSQAHWSVAKDAHVYWGGGMAMGDNGVWYACIIVADEAKEQE